MIDHAKKLRALVVEDDARMVPTIEDTLFSMGHEFDLATNQCDAQRLLDDRDFSYVLLDLEIPARPKRRQTHKDFGVNLLARLQQTKNRGRIPAIVMADRKADYLDVVGEVIRLGASDFITKPFPKTGRTLSKVILRALKKAESTPQTVGSPPNTVRPFEGGQLTIFPDRMELCGVTICSGRRNGMIYQILEILSKGTDSGLRPAYSGSELAELVGCQGGENGIAGCIRDFRGHVSEALAEKVGLRCGIKDVIESGGPGYRLNPWIAVRRPDSAANLQGHDDPLNRCPDLLNSDRDPLNDPINFTGDPLNASAGHADAPLNRRRAWILGELAQGHSLRVPRIVQELGCSDKTAKRMLETLRQEGRVEFVGPKKTGYYRLRS